MIDNMPQQNSPFQLFEAKVFIPVWETGEREGEACFFIVCIKKERNNTMKTKKKTKEGGKRETYFGK